MNPLIELNLALILFVPWFAILAVLFWRYPRQPRTFARRSFDAASLLLATVLAAIGMVWSIGHADPHYGRMWPQVLATSIAYALFLAAMALAVLLRWRWLRGPRDAALHSPTPDPAA